MGNTCCKPKKVKSKIPEDKQAVASTQRVKPRIEQKLEYSPVVNANNLAPDRKIKVMRVPKTENGLKTALKAN
jgi:hypothetical protein